MLTSNYLFGSCYFNFIYILYLDMKHDVTTIYRIQDHFIPRLSDFADCKWTIIFQVNLHTQIIVINQMYNDVFFRDFILSMFKED